MVKRYEKGDPMPGQRLDDVARRVLSKEYGTPAALLRLTGKEFAAFLLAVALVMLAVFVLAVSGVTLP